MILSFWRKSHLLLAISASLFLIIASITGSVLSFEPINNSLKESYVGNENEQSLAQLVAQLDEVYLEVFEIEVDEKDRLKISVLDEEGEFQSYYIHPKTGEKVKAVTEENALFNFCRILHRSLFLGSSGRFIMGIASFLLLLISISGIALVIKRQLSLFKFFSEVTNSTKNQYNHIVLGRLSVFTLLIIAFTGSFLFMKRFELVSETPVQEINYSELDFKQFPQKSYANFATFQNIPLRELKSVQFPFSSEVEDYFEVELIDKKILINQFNGSILTEISHTALDDFIQLNFNLHTGKGSVLWSIVLCISSLSILFFIYSGFKMTLSRRKGQIKNKFNKTDCTTVILVGSEGGQSWRYANFVYQQLRQNKEKVFVDDLNNYTHYPKLENLLIITSTYGNGTAPSNANQFLEKFKKTQQEKPFNYCVLAFGSIDYENYCQFGQDVFKALSQDKDNHPSLPITLINKQSEQQFKSWVTTWFSTLNYTVDKSFSNERNSVKNEFQKFKIIAITPPNKKNNQTFILELKSKKGKIQPGDLLLFSPDKSENERYYSCGLNQKGHIILIIKKHEFGKASRHLSALKKGNKIYGRILENPHFHFPSSENDVIAICNGTGIAPFIGMPEKCRPNQKFSIYWGLKSEEFFGTVQPNFDTSDVSLVKANIHTCFSALRDTAKTYVQEKIERDGEYVAQVLEKGGAIMICGSIEMRNAVLHVLDEITKKYNDHPLENYAIKQQIKIDCY